MACFDLCKQTQDLHADNIGVSLPRLDEHAERNILDYFQEPYTTLVVPRKPHPQPESLPPYLIAKIAFGEYYKNREPSFNMSPIRAEIMDLGNGE